MHGLEAGPFLAAICDPRLRLEVERFGRSTVPESWALEHRRIDEHYLTLYLDREAELQVGGRTLLCRPGSAVLVAPGVAHSIRPRAGRFTFYHWRFRLWRGRSELRCAEDAVLRERAAQLRPLMDAAYDEQVTAQLHGPLRQRALLAAVLAELLRPEADAERGLDQHQRRRVLDLVANRPPGGLSPAALARACDLSHDYFSRRFRESFGCAPRSWLLRERLRQAADDLLGSDDPIGSVATRWGFDSLFVFSRQFRQQHGLSPSAYRQHRRR